MRLPVTPLLSTKDGVSNKNARLTNALKDVRSTGELAVVRPGLNFAATASGIGRGIVSFNDTLFAVYGQTLSVLDNRYASVSWAAETSAEDNQWRGMAYSPSLELFVAVALDGTNRVMTSPDGETWTARSCPTNEWCAVIWCEEFGLFVAVSASTSGNITMSSPNGIDWTSGTSVFNGIWDCLAFDGTRIVAGTVSSIPGAGMTSTNGTTWSSMTFFANAFPTGIVYAESIDTWVCVGSAGLIGSSSDGLSWTLRSTDAASVWRSVCWSEELSLFVAVADIGTVRIKTSPDGINWTSRTAPNTNAWFSVTWASEIDMFIAVAYSGTLNMSMVSSNGITWYANATPNSNAYLAVIWSDSQRRAVAVGNTGTGNRAMTAVLSMATVATVTDKYFDFVQSVI